MIRFFLSLLLGSQVVLAADLSLAPGTRSYPFSASMEAKARHEYILWDQRADAFWKFGFLQPQATLAAHGLAEVGISVFPISFFELGASLSSTSRFYQTKPFDCDQSVCEGSLKRERLSARWLAGAGDWLAVLSLHRLWVSASDESRPFVDEVEVLRAQAGKDTFEAASLLAGKKIKTDFAGLYLKQGRYLGAGVHNESQYLLFKKSFETHSGVIGVGRYASDFSEPGFSVYATLIWTWGKSLALN